MTAPLAFSPEVAEARAAGRPARRAGIAPSSPMACPIRRTSRPPGGSRPRCAPQGAVPATIAVMDGRIHVGLTEARTGRAGSGDRAWRSCRAPILPPASPRARTGATTVAATMICAHLAGIAVFATGGIGGVHRGAETSFDISADLRELAADPGHRGRRRGQGDPRPAEDAGGAGNPWRPGHRLRAGRIARLLVAHLGPAARPCAWTAPPRSPPRTGCARTLGLPGGQLVANPIPEADEIPRDDDPAPYRGGAGRGRSARHRGQGGDALPAATASSTLTEGRSLTANIALVLNNARLGGRDRHAHLRAT